MRLLQLAVVTVALVLLAAGAARPVPSPPDDDHDGNASSGLSTTPANPGVEAAFEARSYAPGARATLRLTGRAPVLQLRLFHAGAGSSGPLQGAPLGPARTLHAASSRIAVSLGDWPSGLYYAQLVTPGRGVWFAPFVLRPRRLGAHRVLVVLPTNTWQAYNFLDGDSWYYNSSVHEIDLARPLIDGGVPPHYHGYDRGFIRWLALHHEHVDFVSDDDLDRVASAAELARAYDLVVFSGHEEYVTTHEYDLIDGYRDLGGNLAFLSANDFFYEVIKSGDRMNGRWRWRDLGRPEASLVGAQYVDWNHDRYPNRPFTVTATGAAPWLFRGTPLRDGSTFGVYGIEVDAVDGSSPPGTRVLARIPGIFGPGVTAEMTYYVTPSGAKVFSAGVMNFGGSALWPTVSKLLTNLWAKLTRP